ncbi:response regulator transcription factor [Lyngbya confervoides]|uniref:Response regulator n=1 Tax=Lyngbya confervoides BDU141951 TaxID=1574623 RepID=A0ABD4T8R5_9CYAN|nr:response regulator [Lyngbya confervoides]MCM1984883.1 response regulator [Lyngbya confervoides BDU141951]
MKVLLVDDDQNTGISLSHTLLSSKYVVNLVTDSQTALKMAEFCDYDLILLNLLPQSEDSYLLCRDLRRDGYQGPILLLSRIPNGNEQTACVRGIDSGANACLSDPYEVEELLDRMKTLLC